MTDNGDFVPENADVIHIMRGLQQANEMLNTRNKNLIEQRDTLEEEVSELITRIQWLESELARLLAQ